MAKKSDFEQLMGILEEFDYSTVQRVVDEFSFSRGLIFGRIAIPSLFYSPVARSQKDPITLSGDCKWQRIGKSDTDYTIAHTDTDSSGKLEIVCHNSGVTEPAAVTAQNKIAPDLEKGQSTRVSNRDCTSNNYIWVHAKGGNVDGYWS